MFKGYIWTLKRSLLLSMFKFSVKSENGLEILERVGWLKGAWMINTKNNLFMRMQYYIYTNTHTHVIPSHGNACKYIYIYIFYFIYIYSLSLYLSFFKLKINNLKISFSYEKSKLKRGQKRHTFILTLVVFGSLYKGSHIYTYLSTIDMHIYTYP